MKNSIKLTALFLLASAGLFAAVPSKSLNTEVPEVTVSSLASNKGIAVKTAAEKSLVMIYDQDNNVLRKDIMGNNSAKGYILNTLENGDYILEVISNKQSVKKNIHIYNEGATKTFIVKE